MYIMQAEEQFYDTSARKGCTSKNVDVDADGPHFIARRNTSTVNFRKSSLLIILNSHRNSY